jgi:hypothetical protein
LLHDPAHSLRLIAVSILDVIHPRLQSLKKVGNIHS